QTIAMLHSTCKACGLPVEFAKPLADGLRIEERPAVSTSEDMAGRFGTPFPAEPVRLMRPGRRPYRFDGAMLLEAYSKPLAGTDKVLAVKVFQRADMVLVLHMLIEDNDDERCLIMTRDALGLAELRDTALSCDPATFAGLFWQRSLAKNPDDFTQISDQIAQLRAEYTQAINAIFPETGTHNEKRDAL
ncbi:MAG: hypothetical protein AAFR27_15510, partial [Pseudomonadota bacterium]